MKKLFITIAFILSFFIFLPVKVRAQKTIYYYDASSYLFDRFDYCAVNNKSDCADNIPPRPWSELITNLDRLYFLSSLQGLVNRSGPKLWLKVNKNSRYDDFWWQQFRDGSQPYGFLSDYNVVELNSFDQVLNTFKNDLAINGAVDYSTQYHGAGLAVAKTVAGADNLVIVRQGSSIYGQITSYFPKKVSVPNFEHKPQVYQWAINNYLKTGKSNPQLLEYNLDAWPIVLYQQEKLGESKNSAVINFDYVIMKKGFSFDLSNWEGEKPVDDPGQVCGGDYQILKQILQTAQSKVNNSSQYKDKIVQVWGYVPWFWKYYGGNPSGEGVRCGTSAPSDNCYFNAVGTCNEQKFIQLAGQYQAVNTGAGTSTFGAHPSNFSVMHWGPKPEESKMVNPPPPTRQELIDRGFLTAENQVVDRTYVLAYHGDYEHDGQTAMVHGFWPLPWERQRGNIPAAWNISTQALETIPAVVNYWANSRGENDYIVAGFTGAGYAYPNYFSDSSLVEWKKHSAYQYSINGINISMALAANGNHDVKSPSSNVFNAYSSFSPQGINTYMDRNRPTINRGVPVSAFQSPGRPVGSTETQIADKINSDWNKLDGSMPKFLTFRSVFYGPNLFNQALDAEKSRHPGRKYTVVDPYTFYYLLRLDQNGNNNNKAAYYIKQEWPKTFQPGKSYTFTIVARNDGWNNWYGQGSDQCQADGKGCFRLGYGISSDMPEPVYQGQMPKFDYDQRAGINTNIVRPGESYQYQINFTVPSQPGTYFLRADIVNELNYWFEWQGNLALTRKIIAQEATCPVCPTGLPKDQGNADCNNSINLVDFAAWLKVFKTGGSETEKQAVNFDCEAESDSVDLADFSVWLDNFMAGF